MDTTISGLVHLSTGGGNWSTILCVRTCTISMRCLQRSSCMTGEKRRCATGRAEKLKWTILQLSYGSVQVRLAVTFGCWYFGDSATLYHKWISLYTRYTIYISSRTLSFFGAFAMAMITNVLHGSSKVVTKRVKNELLLHKMGILIVINYWGLEWLLLYIAGYGQVMIEEHNLVQLGMHTLWDK